MPTLKFAAYIVLFAVVIYYLKQYMNGPMCKSTARLDDKVIIVTGANTGIGKETALDLVKRGGKVYLGCRSTHKCQAATEDILQQIGADKAKVIPLQLDLASKHSIRVFVNNFSARESRLDVLVNNAGVAWLPEYTTTEDGFETTFGVNHLGHFLLTSLLVPELLQARPSRVVMVSGNIHKFFNYELGMMNEKNYSVLSAYALSKAYNILFANELARRFQGHGITTYSLHPGVILTELLRYNLHFLPAMLTDVVLPFVLSPLLKSPTYGAQTSVCCAVDEALAEDTGKYYMDCSEEQACAAVKSEENAKALWDYSVNLLQLKPADLHPLLR